MGGGPFGLSNRPGLVLERHPAVRCELLVKSGYLGRNFFMTGVREQGGPYVDAEPESQMFLKKY